MKQISLLILLLAAIGTKAQDTAAIETCKTTGFDSLDLRHLKTQLLGNWEYSYSFYKDSCFVLNKPIALSKTYTFSMADTVKMRKTLPWIYKFTHGKLLFGLQSSHEPKGSVTKSYPTTGGKKTKTGKLHIFHYEGEGPGKVYMYFLEGLDAANMVLSDEFNYDTGTKKIAHVKHVYRRKK